MTECMKFAGFSDKEGITKFVERTMPFCCCGVDVSTYHDLVLNSLGSCEDEIDISCNSSAADDFCGNPIFREKVNLRMKDFIAAWSQQRCGKHHWILDADLFLYLSQCCFSCPSDLSVCDLNSNLLHIPQPSLFDGGLECSQSNLWMNIHKARSTLHYDASDNLLVLVHGTKHVTLLSPSCTRHLKPACASDENPNHSNLNYDEVEEWINQLLSQQKSSDRSNSSESLFVYKIIMNAGDVLYIPEGWWHQVCSDPCSMALNFWFTRGTTNSTTDADRLHQRPYELRKSVHSLLVAEQKRLQSLQPFTVSSSWYTSSTTFSAFEAKLLSANTLVERASVCGKRSAEIEIVPDDRQSAPEVQAVQQTWMEFVRCSFEEQRRLWIPFAEAHPEVWQRVLLRLCPAACAHLLDYWDTLQHNPGNSAKPGGSATSTATEATHDTVVVEARGKELDSFFAALFSPCGDNVSEIRRHLIEQKNRNNATVIKGILGDILGMQFDR